MRSFVEWFEHETGQLASDVLLEQAFVMAVCRMESAAAQHAPDPIACLGNGTSRLSRAATKVMFGQLGYTPSQIRIVQRLLAGSAGGWPGLLRLYVNGEVIDAAKRAYIARQFRLFRAADAREVYGDRPGALTSDARTKVPLSA